MNIKEQEALAQASADKMLSNPKDEDAFNKCLVDVMFVIENIVNYFSHKNKWNKDNKEDIKQELVLKSIHILKKYNGKIPVVPYLAQRLNFEKINIIRKESIEKDPIGKDTKGRERPTKFKERALSHLYKENYYINIIRNSREEISALIKKAAPATMRDNSIEKITDFFYSGLSQHEYAKKNNVSQSSISKLIETLKEDFIFTYEEMKEKIGFM